MCGPSHLCCFHSLSKCRWLAGPAPVEHALIVAVEVDLHLRCRYLASVIGCDVVMKSGTTLGCVVSC